MSSGQYSKYSIFWNKIISSKFVLGGAIVFFILLTVLSFRIPFFWDNVSVIAEAGTHIFNNHLSSIILPENLDAGHVPLIALYFAVMWTLFGKSLIVSHLIMLPFVIGLIWEFYKLSKQFLSEEFIKISLLFLLLEPVFCTQTILMGYDVILAYFFFASINCLQKNQRIRLLIMLSFLAMINLRGIPLTLAVFLIHFFVYRDVSKRSFLKQNIFLYFLPIAIAGSWLIFHYNIKGWFIIAPSREVQRQINSTAMLIRQTLYIGWKLADYGKIFFWIFIILSSVKFYKTDVQIRKILLILFMPIICLSVSMIPFSNPVGHKYFLTVYLFLPIAMAYHIKLLKSSWRAITIVLFCIISFFGNFIMYPERFGNGWDTSLKVLSYFPLKEKMDGYITENKIESKEIGASFPMFGDERYSKLSNEEFVISDIDNKPLEKWNYIILSNISNSYSDQLKAEIRSKWKLMQKFKSGQVYLELYQNPFQ